MNFNSIYYNSEVPKEQKNLSSELMNQTIIPQKLLQNILKLHYCICLSRISYFPFKKK